MGSTNGSHDGRDRAIHVSVIVEGYNESVSLGSAVETLEALRRQTYPLDRVEVILVGSTAQASAWERRRTVVDLSPFAEVRFLGVDGVSYYEMKNWGAREASGEIFAFTDSDATPSPGWLDAIVAAIEGGADVSAGLTCYRSEGGLPSSHPLMQAAAAISWGFIVGDATDGPDAVPREFLSNNLGVRADVFRQFFYREDLGRTCAGTLLYRALIAGKRRVVLSSDQRVAHNFSFRWWVSRLHRRFGHEVFRLKRLDAASRHRWVTRLGPLEPVLTAAWHVLLDVPQWLRYSRAAQIGFTRRVASIPLVVALSLFARGAEMIGMYETIVTPEAMARFAASN